jgi:hypothetical protein
MSKNLLQFSHGILVQSDDVGKQYSEPLEIFNPHEDDLPENPLVLAQREHTLDEHLEPGKDGDEDHEPALEGDAPLNPDGSAPIQTGASASLIPGAEVSSVQITPAAKGAAVDGDPEKQSSDKKDDAALNEIAKDSTTGTAKGADDVGTGVAATDKKVAADSAKK